MNSREYAGRLTSWRDNGHPAAHLAVSSSVRSVVSSDPTRPHMSYQRLRRLADLAAHESYLQKLLDGYDGPYRDRWVEELARVRAIIARESGAPGSGDSSTDIDR
jgi:hypothetical protein